MNYLNTDAASIQLLNGRRLEEVLEDAVMVDVPANITGMAMSYLIQKLSV